MEKNDSVLVKKLSKGDLLAFNTLFKEYSGRIYRFAVGYLKSEAEAEDLVQEVFMIIWEKRAELKVELSFKSFLFTITFNLIKKHFRTKAQISKYLKTEISDDVDMQTSHEITYASLNQNIIRLVNLLPKRRKEIFIKSRFKGQNIKEIAEEMKISHKTVENQLTQALKFLRIHLHQENILTILLFVLFIS